MPLADLEVSRVVRRGDLQRSGTEVALHRFIGDDRDEPVGERDADLAADQVSVTFIVRVNRDRGVSEDRLGPDRGDVDVPPSSGSYAGVNLFALRSPRLTARERLL